MNRIESRMNYLKENNIEVINGDIKVETKEGETKIDVNIIVEYGVRIPDVAFEIQNKVKKSVEEKTGLKVSGVNVHIQGVKTEINEPQEIIVDGKNEEK